MGLPPLLVDTYCRYKSGTKAFVQWLAESARATGTVDEVFERSLPRIETSKKKKKAAKKQARTTVITTGTLTRLANAVVKPEGSQVPMTIISVLQDVIKARKSCASWYRAHQEAETEKEKEHNSGHQHFITVLEDVRGILASKVIETNKTKENGESGRLPKSANRFGHLLLEECSGLMEPEDISTPSENKKKVPTMEYRIEESAEDLSFGIYCHMKDLTEIRVFVRRTWREYKQGYITLNTAATTANAALAVMRRLNDEFVENFPKFSQHGDIIDFLYDGYCGPNSRTLTTDGLPDFATYETDSLRLSSRTFFCDHTHNILKSFFGTAEMPFYQESYSQHLTADEVVLVKCLSLLGMLDKGGRFTKHQIIFDQIFGAIRTMRATKNFPSWAIFAIQVFIDTRRELDTKTEQGLLELRKNTIWIVDGLKACIEYDKEFRVGGIVEKNLEVLKRVIGAMEPVVTTDVVQTSLKECFGKQLEKAEKYNWGPNFLFKNHPIMCGIILQAHLAEFHRMGTILAGEQTPIRAAIHLLHAAHITGEISRDMKWADLEYIIRMHGDPYIFVGHRPTDLWESYLHLDLCLGAAATLQPRSKNSSTDDIILKALGKSRMPMQSRIRKLNFMSRLVQVTDRREGKVHLHSRAIEDPGYLLEKIVTKYMSPQASPHPANPLVDAKEANRRLVPLDSLIILKKALKEDDFPLRFNLFDLNWRCIKSLRLIQKICVEDSPDYYPVAEYGSSCRVAAVLSQMLEYAAMDPCYQANRFSEACQIFASTMRSGGNSEYLKAEARLSIVSGTAVLTVDDPKELEDPIRDNLPFDVRKFIDCHSLEDWERIRSIRKEASAGSS